MRRIFVLTISMLLLAGSVTLAGDGGEKKSWFDKMKIKGDLRLRYEGFDKEGSYDDGRRDRFRFRLRTGLYFQVRDDLQVAFQVRSGNPDDPVSDNATFDGGFNKKDLAIAEAFVDWKANDTVSIIAGKFGPKKLWTVSDMNWDDDVVVEGVMERFKWGGNDGALKKIEANLYQFILNESGSGSDTYLFGGQISPTVKVNDTNELALGLGYDAFSNPEEIAELTWDGDLSGNNVTNLVYGEGDMLVSDFRIANVFAIWKNKSNKKWPVKVSLFFYKNTGAGSTVGFDNTASGAIGSGDDNDTAYFARVQIGDYKKKGQMAFRLSRYDSDPDALFYAYTQSDTTRSSNVDGFRFDWRIGMPAKGYINVTWYNTEAKLGQVETMDRWQIDYIFKF